MEQHLVSHARAGTGIHGITVAYHIQHPACMPDNTNQLDTGNAFSGRRWGNF